MARKRKSLAAATPQVAEPVQPIQSEPEPEKPQPEKTQEILEEKPLIENKLVAAVAEEPAVEDEVVADVEEEEPRVEDEVIGDAEEEEEEGGDGVEETKNDAVLADSIKNEQQSETTDKAASVNGDEDEEEDEDDEEDEDEEDEEEVEEEPVEKLLEPFSKDQLTLIIKEALAKHPDIVESVHKLADADPSHRKIFVHGLGWEASTDTITSVFGKYGEIEDCKVVKDKISGKSKGYGFILFKHRVGARRALKQPQKLIEGRMTSSQLASAGPVRTASPAVAAAATASTPPLSEYTQRKIYVSNVSAELDPKKLMEFFAKFGEIEEGPLGLDKQTGKPRGFCLFVYKSAKSASKALEEPHKNFEGQMLHCQKAVDGPKHSKGFFNQQQSQPNQQHQEGGNQGYYGHTAKKGRYSGSSEGVGHTGGHLMAPSGGGSAMPPMGFNPAVAPAAIGQAVAALLASQGAGLGIGNFLGGMGGGANHPMMNNPAYGGQGGGGYGGQPGMQGGYGGQPQMGRGGVRPPRGGGAPYMGRGR